MDSEAQREIAEAKIKDRMIIECKKMKVEGFPFE